MSDNETKIRMEQIRRDHMCELRVAACWVGSIVLWIIVGTIVKYTWYDLSWLIVLLPILIIAAYGLLGLISFMVLVYASYLTYSDPLYSKSSDEQKSN
jgi:hypothetical protein